MKLIKLEDAIEATKKQEVLIGACGVTAEIKTLEALEGVEIVRCRDCKYARQTIDGSWMCSEATGREWVGEDHFCSYGERKCE